MDDDDFLDALNEGPPEFEDDVLNDILLQEEERMLRDERQRLEDKTTEGNNPPLPDEDPTAIHDTEALPTVHEDEALPLDPPTSEDEDSQLPRRVVHPPTWDAKDVVGSVVIPVTSTETFERVYCSSDDVATTLPAALQGEQHRQWRRQWRRQGGAGLTSVPMGELMAQVEAKRLEDAIRESERVRAQIAAKRSSGGATTASASAMTHADLRQHAAQERQAELWVDKYRPRRVIELLNDEAITRQLLHWVRSWNPVVFHKPAPPPLEDEGTQFKYGQRNRPPSSRPKGSDPRPDHKVVLLAGPPGLGKTTLAHVIARHCGYRVVEINASDDRTAGSLTQRIQDAVQMQSVMGERRPNLVVIDEIDGALGGAEGRGAINALLKIVNAGKKAEGKGGAKGRKGEEEVGAGGEDEDGGDGEGAAGTSTTPAKAGRGGSGSGGGKRAGLKPLSRPIICICNDPYVPALRPLREVAHVIHFSRPVSTVLTQRLRTIAEAEGMKCESRALSALVERSEGDIRNCLHSMQFLARQSIPLTLATLQSLKLGQKDMTTSAFGVWEQIFFQRPARSGALAALEAESKEGWRAPYEAVRDFGDYPLLTAGILENLHQARYNNRNMRGTVSVLQWLSECDTIIRSSFRSMDFTLTGYAANLLVMTRSIITSLDRTSVRLEWPRVDQLARTYSRQQTELLRTWLSNCSATVASRSTHGMAAEVVPLFVQLVSPSVRPVAKHLLTIEEKDAIQAFVSTALAYSVRLVDPETLQASGKPGEEVLRGAVPLDPAVDTLALYGPDHPQGKALRGENKRYSVYRPFGAAPVAPAASSSSQTPYLMPPDVTRVRPKAVSAAVRQLLAHEMEVERIRRAAEAAASKSKEGAFGATQGGTALTPGDAPPSAYKAGPVMRTLEERMQANAQNLGSKRKAENNKGQGSWLDTLKRKKTDESRARATKSKLTEIQSKVLTSASKPGAGATTVLYKFNEGYTNAVKHPLILKHLL